MDSLYKELGIHRDLAIEYARWLDPEFSIWVSKKIQELISDGIAWNEIRDATKIDYKPLTQAIAKYIIPQYPYMDKNIVYGRIANFINLKVIGQKAQGRLGGRENLEDYYYL